MGDDTTTTQNPFQQTTVDLAANGYAQIRGPLRYFLFVSATDTSKVYARFGSQRRNGFYTGFQPLTKGFKNGPMVGVDMIELWNKGGVAVNTVTAAYGDADFNYSQATADVNIQVADGGDVALGAKADAAATTDTAAATLIALQKRSLVKSTGALLGQSGSLVGLGVVDVASPGAGKRCVVDALLVNNPDVTAADVQLIEETTGNLFVVHAPAHSCQTHRIPFATAVAAKKLQAQASAAAAILVAAFGRMEA